MSRQPISGIHLVICAALAVSVLVIYRQTLGFKFTNYDDQTYVTENEHVQAGVSPDSLKWAFTTLSGSNWHPLTWISHMLDWQVYGDRSGLHHLTSALIHLLNSIVLFFVFSRMTGSVWRSAFVAALFAVHPLHVESVAWIAERKDVLSALFWMLTMWAYTRYVEGPSVKRYLPVLLFFALGLMAKPMLVTLPFALILLDYWPLRRLDRNLWPLLLEKLPLAVLAAASGAVTYLAQQRGGAVLGLQAIPLGLRLSNAIVMYVVYMGRTLWPQRLAAFYPYSREALGVWPVAGAAVALVILTALAVLERRKRPYIAVGWFWYIGTLVPVIGLVQVGGQAAADRYTYIPLIGLFAAIAWLVPNFFHREEEPARERRPLDSGSRGTPVGLGKITLAVTALAAVFALTALARVQAGYWRDSITLFSHALEVTTGNTVAHNNLGLALADEGRTKEAMDQYREALRVSPTDPDANYNLGRALAHQGKYEQAAGHYRRSLDSRPDCPETLDGLGNALVRLGHADRAVDCYRKALELDSNDAGVHNNMANALFRQGKFDESISELNTALKLKPYFADAHSNLAIVLYNKGDYAGAWHEVHLTRRYGGSPSPGFLNALSWKMPEPSGEQ